MLFLCADNTCRSPIAEAIARYHCGDTYNVSSAGFTPGREVHPLARQVLAEIGIHLDRREPQPFRAALGGEPIDLAIVLCNESADPEPTTWPGGTTRLVWPVPNPALAGGSELERLAAFRRIRDDIETHIRRWLADPDIAWA